VVVDQVRVKVCQPLSGERSEEDRGIERVTEHRQFITAVQRMAHCAQKCVFSGTMVVAVGGFRMGRGMAMNQYSAVLDNMYVHGEQRGQREESQSRKRDKCRQAACYRSVPPTGPGAFPPRSVNENEIRFHCERV